MYEYYRKCNIHTFHANPIFIIVHKLIIRYQVWLSCFYYSQPVSNWSKAKTGRESSFNRSNSNIKNSIFWTSKNVIWNTQLWIFRFLHNNRIKHIPPGAFDDLPSLKRLRLDGNAIVCDCSITWFMKMVNENSSPQGQLQTAATCNAPDNMKGLSIVNMDKNDLHCGNNNFILTP